MTKKRKAYITKEGQNKANRRYLDNHPDKRKQYRIATLRSEGKSFIRNHATLDEITDLRILLKEREKLLRLK